MDELITLLEKYDLNSLIIIIALLILAAFGVAGIVKKIKSVFEDYHTGRNAQEDKERLISERLNKLEEEEVEDKKQLAQISTSIEDLRKIIEKVQENQNRSNIATCRSAMYRLANELIEKKWMSQTEYETLSDLSDVYLMAGGSNYVRPSTIQRALMLPVLTDDEIANHMYERIVDNNNNRRHN